MSHWSRNSTLKKLIREFFSWAIKSLFNQMPPHVPTIIKHGSSLSLLAQKVSNNYWKNQWTDHLVYRILNDLEPLQFHPLPLREIYRNILPPPHTPRTWFYHLTLPYSTVFFRYILIIHHSESFKTPRTSRTRHYFSVL